MRTRYFLIEPKYSDPDTFCSFIVGSDRIRASIQIYADMWMLSEVAGALIAPALAEEWPSQLEFQDDAGYGIFRFYLTVLPHQGDKKQLRFRVFQEWLDDGAPYRADIRFELTSDEAAEIEATGLFVVDEPVRRLHSWAPWCCRIIDVSNSFSAKGKLAREIRAQRLSLTPG